MRAASALLLLLAACGGDAPDEGKLSADEERQLNEAAAMLDEPTEEVVSGEAKDGAEEDE